MDKFLGKMDKFISDMKKINVFGGGRSGDLNLPGAGLGSRGNNGVSFSTLNFSVLLSIIWLLCSLGAVGLGFWHCRNRASNFGLNCTLNECELIRNREAPINFLRKDLTSATYVRINADNEVVDTSKMKSKQARSFGYSVELKFQWAEDINSRFKAEKKTLFALEDMGSGLAKRSTSKITKGISKSGEPLNEKYGSWVTAIGLLSIIFGSLSALISLLFGQWQDTPRRLKKAS
jgi:hypothetical protein